MKRQCDQSETGGERQGAPSEATNDQPSDMESSANAGCETDPKPKILADPRKTATPSEDSDQKQPANRRGHSDGSQHRAGTSVFLPGILSDLSIDLPDFVKRNNTTLTFPEKLMIMLTHIEKLFDKAPRLERSPVEWVQDGHVVYIRDKDTLAKEWLPLFFQQTKFSSFTRKLYRWGFRQYSSPGEASKSSSSMYFFNENFRRNDHSLLSRMRSTTAAGLRREEAAADAKKQADVNRALAPGQTDSLAHSLQGNSSAPSSAGLTATTQPYSSLSFVPIASSGFSVSSDVLQALSRDAIQLPSNESLHLHNQLQLLAQLRSVRQVDPVQQWPSVASTAFLGQRSSPPDTDIIERLIAQNQLSRQRATLPTPLPHLVQQLTVDNGPILQETIARTLLQQRLSEQRQQEATSAFGHGLIGGLDRGSIIEELLTQLHRRSSSQSDLNNRLPPP